MGLLMEGHEGFIGLRRMAQARALMDRAFRDDFDDDDWEHARGGHHVVLLEDHEVVAHAAVVRRQLWIGDLPVEAGYVEAVAVTPEHQGFGLGATVMRAARSLIERHHEIGALSTGEHDFYERYGWVRWEGPTFVRRPDGDERTPDDDDGVMVLLHEGSPAVDRTAPLTCEDRPGDVW